MTGHFSLRRFPLYVREGFFWGLPSIYTVSHGSMYPGSRRCTQIETSNNEVSVARERFLRKLDGLPFELELAFVRSALFCGRSDFANAKAFAQHIWAIREYTHTPYLQRRTRPPGHAANDRGSQPARQSSRSRYAVGLRCVCPDGQRPPALNADYSGSNGSGRSATTVSAYHQV